MKQLITLAALVMLATSCQKEYYCVCKSAKTNDDTLVEHVKTTRLGSKGYEKTCAKHESQAFSNCHLK